MVYAFNGVVCCRCKRASSMLVSGVERRQRVEWVRWSAAVCSSASSVRRQSRRCGRAVQDLQFKDLRCKSCAASLQFKSTRVGIVGSLPMLCNVGFRVGRHCDLPIGLFDNCKQEYNLRQLYSTPVAPLRQVADGAQLLANVCQSLARTPSWQHRPFQTSSSLHAACAAPSTHPAAHAACKLDEKARRLGATNRRAPAFSVQASCAIVLPVQT